MPSDIHARLAEARAHLDRAKVHLDASPSDYAGALERALCSCRASLDAFLLHHGATPRPGAPLDAIAQRAVRSDSVLKTAARRAVQLVKRAPAIEPSSPRLSIHDREDVQTGWYTARNLYQTVAGRLVSAS